MLEQNMYFLFSQAKENILLFLKQKKDFGFVSSSKNISLVVFPNKCEKYFLLSQAEYNI